MINSIIREYQSAGYKLTLRQLYYQLVSRDVIPNKVSEYAKLSNLLKEGRMSGEVDWSAIEDRLRRPEKPATWDDPKQVLRAAMYSFKSDYMKNQPNYLETWVEKDALSGVLSRVTEQYHVPIMVNRGYSSVSAMYEAYNRFKDAIANDKKVIILYLGDFDPSGVDMIRDIRSRILEFLHNCSSLRSHYFDVLTDRDSEDYDPNKDPENDHSFDEFLENYEEAEGVEYYERGFYAWIEYNFRIEGIALTREQINKYNPPRNPAKITDPRAAKFIAEHGSSSWEVDALKPEVLHSLLDENIVNLLDMDKLEKIKKADKLELAKLTVFVDSYPDKEETEKSEEDEDFEEDED